MSKGLSATSLTRIIEGMTLGALVAGAYGILHDQVTYTLGESYFTDNKFIQFSRFDYGWPVHAFVALIGFLATWWVGVAVGWALVRLTPLYRCDRPWRPYFFKGIGITLGIALLSGIVGYFLPAADSFDLVHNIHSASYFGGLVGAVIAVFTLRSLRLS